MKIKLKDKSYSMSGEFIRDDGQGFEYEETIFYLDDDIGETLKDLKREILTKQSNPEDTIRLIHKHFEGF